MAVLLRVNARTVRRWAENPEEMPGPAEHAIWAWCRLKFFKHSWRPDSKPLGDEAGWAAKIDSYRKQDYEIVGPAIKRVMDDGGPKLPWRIDLDAGEATLGHMTVEFYEIGSTKFAANSYRRSDGRDLDTERDCQLLDDAYACIALAFHERDRKRKSKFCSPFRKIDDQPKSS
ncbi:MAG: hypothetical protein WD795_01785 [Woeseia sp.]